MIAFHIVQIKLALWCHRNDISNGFKVFTDDLFALVSDAIHALPFRSLYCDIDDTLFVSCPTPTNRHLV